MSDELHLDIQPFQPRVLPISHDGASAIHGRTSVASEASSQSKKSRSGRSIMLSQDGSLVTQTSHPRACAEVQPSTGDPSTGIL